MADRWATNAGSYGAEYWATRFLSQRAESPGHRDNLTDGCFNAVGHSMRAGVKDGIPGYYVTQVFGGYA